MTITKVWLREKYWEEGLCLSEMGLLAGVSLDTIWKRMKTFGIPRRTLSEAQRLSRGEKSRRWKGGRRTTTDGYMLWHQTHFTKEEMKILEPMWNKSNPYIFLHRAVMALWLGRPLESWECVHHMNGQRDDNCLENLQLVDRHRRQICPRCGWPMQNPREGKDETPASLPDLRDVDAE